MAKAKAKTKVVETTPDPNLLDVATKVLTELRKGPRSTSNYGLVFDNGHFINCPGNICYAGLPSYEGVIRSEAAAQKIGSPTDTRYPPVRYFIDCMAKPWVSDKECYKWLKWVANESWWAPIMLHKEPERIKEEGQIFTTDMPPQWVVAGGVLHRYPHEEPGLVQNWVRFSEVVDPHAALLLAHMSQTKYLAKEVSTSSYVLTPQWNANNNNHTIFQPWRLRPESLVRLLRNTPLLKGLRPMSETRRYSGMVDIWYSPSDSNQSLVAILPDESVPMNKEALKKVAVNNEKANSIQFPGSNCSPEAGGAIYEWKNIDKDLPRILQVNLELAA